MSTTGSIILRRGPTVDRLAFCPLEGEIIYDTELKKLFVGDSVTFGGNNVISEIIVDPNGIPIILPISILEYNTISGVQLGNDLKTLTLGPGLTGTSYNGSTAVTVTVNSDSANTPNKIVIRDSFGNFSAGTITASLNGNAATATKLQSPVAINNSLFDGSSNITVTASANTLTGTTINPSVLYSNLTSVGTLSNLTVTNTINGSINGNAATVTNGVYTTGSYPNPYWIPSLSETKVLPSQTGNEGKYLSTNGTQSAWVSASSIGFPVVLGNAGKFLSTNGTSVFWDTVTTMASGIFVTPAGNISSTNVQSALVELDNEKAPKSNPTFTGVVSGITPAMVGLGYVENTALSTWSGSSSITTLGNISSGAWYASNIGLNVGGTNASLTAVSGGIVYSTASALAISNAGSLGQVLTSNGSGIPTWSDQSSVTSGSVGSSITFNNSGSGDVSGTAFNGSTGKIISYNTIGASPLAGSSSITTVGTLVALTVSGVIAANSSSGITTTQTTFPLINTTAVTVNFAGAATSINIGAATGTTTVNHSLEIGGDLNVQGGITAGGPNVLIGATNLSVSDNMIYLNNGIEATITNAVGDNIHVVYTADNNYVVGMLVTITGMVPTSFNVTNAVITAANSTSFTIVSNNIDSFSSGGIARAKTNLNPDLGFAAGYNNGTYQHTGLFRDATDDTWKFFRGYTPEPDDSVFINTSHASFSLAPLAIADLTTTGVTTTQTTFPLVNTTATTINFAGAASTLNIGATQTVFNSTNSIQIPVGTTAERDGTPSTGQIRYNSDLSTFEGYAASAWGSLGGVKSVDGYTYIIAETSAGASNGDLDFYAENAAGNASIQIGQWNRSNLKDYTGTLVGTKTTQNVFNTTATTVNFAGAATTLSIGASSGTTTINSDVNLAKGITDTSVGSSWISQKTDSTVLIKESNTQGNGYTYRAFIQSTNNTYTYTIGRLSNLTIGFYGFLNTRTANGTDFSCAMDNNGSWNVTGQTISSKGYREGVVAIGTVSGTSNLDLSLGNIFTITLGASGVVFTFTNPPASGTACYITLILTQGAGGSKTFGSITNARWTDSVAPVLTTTAGKVDILTLVTVDGGSNYYGSFSGANFG